MNLKNKLVLFTVSVFLFFGFLVQQAHAADLYLISSGQNLGIGAEFNVDVKINSPDDAVNASEATVNFPVSILELVGVNKDGSIFNFWVEEPAVSNENGTVRFVGGTTKGVAGASLQVVRLKFKTKGAGTASLNIADAAVTASDGKGTNVLARADGLSIAVGTKSDSTVSLPSAPPSTSSGPVVAPVQPVEQPQKIVRPTPVVVATMAPKKPEARVSLYPDQTQWYSTLGETIALWTVPEDITQVAVSLNNNPNTVPSVAEKELFTGKNLGVLKEGIWYVHIRFRNNRGWGETTHYKISLDTTAPLPFEIQIDNPVSDNPIPEIRFTAQDALSGVESVKLFIDNKEVAASTTLSAFKLPPQPPGPHRLVARVFDFAGNSVEDDVEFEILPLPQPVVDFVTTSIQQDQDIFASGQAVANGFADIKLTNKKGQDVFNGEAPASGSGDWQITINERLPLGQYNFSVAARDGRGALSYPTDPVAVKVKAKTIISLGFVDLGWFEISLMLILLIGAGLGLGGWYYLANKEKRSAYGVILARDIDKLAVLLQSQLSELETAIFSPDESVRLRVTVFLDKIKETTAKIKKYLSQEAEKMK